MLAGVELERLSNEDLAAECARRPVNEAAWGEFWQRFYPLVYRKVLNVLAPFGRKQIRWELDDVVQLVFLNIFRRLPNYDRQKSPFTAYLSLVAVSTVIDELRRGKNKESVALEELGELADNVNKSGMEADELWQIVVGVLERMTQRDRTVIDELLAGESREAISAKHGITSTLLYTITYRFRQSLREALQK